jgi:cold shock protein
MPTGTIKKWIEDRGYGFIKPEDGGPDVFVHFRAFPRGLQVQEGMRVGFEVTNDAKTGKPQANNVRLL